MDILFVSTAGDTPATATVDLPAQTVAVAGGTEFRFDIDGYRKNNLLRGLDDIGLTLQHADAIREFEAKRRQARPWLF